jgi:HEAT repeat protein
MRILLSGIMLLLLASGSVADEPKTDEVAARVAALMEQFTGPRFVERERAGKALIVIGEPALAALTKAAAGSDPDVAKRAKGCVEEIRVRLHVMRLKTILQGPAPADDRVQAANALLQNHSKRVRSDLPRLIELVDDPDSEVSASVILLIRSFEDAGTPAVPKLIELIESPHAHDRVRECAMMTFCFWGLKDKSVIPVFTRILNDEHSKFHWQAAHVLRFIGKDRADVVTALIKIWKTSKDQRTKASVICALGEIGQQPERVIPVLADALHKPLSQDDQEATVQMNAIWALGKFGSHAQPVVPRLMKLIATDPSEVSTSCNAHFRLAIIQTLQQIGPAAAEAIPLLLQLQQDDIAVRVYCKTALASICK